MFFGLAGGNTLVLHLGMTGRLSVVPQAAPVESHTHLRLLMDNENDELRFADPRRFGEILLYDPATFAARFGPHHLGPDALTIKPAQLAKGLRRTRRRIKAALLDQKAVAGIGNIYADEILFEAGVRPTARCNRLNAEQIGRIHRVMGRVLRRAIRHNGTSIRDYVTGQGVPGEFQNHLKVYGRADQPCTKCPNLVRLDRKVVTGRATYWCPTCQPR